MKKNTQRGFTLVEMTIVLVIIGLILGAVTIGKDVQRNAEYTKVKQKFFDQWVLAYNAYYQRTGVVTGDNQVAPQMMVNGANFAVPSGGNMTTATPPAAICRGAAGPNMARAMQAAGTNDEFNLRTMMQRAGVRMPAGRAEGSEDRYVFLDSNGNPQEIQVCFQWNAPSTPSGAGNVMVITGLTPDLARMLDQMIDGKADAREGLFRQELVANGTGNVPGVEWDVTNQHRYGETGTTPSNLDENQVATVIAHYKMNQ
ncbi:MAG: type II secretion system GspH family protein [Gammaproteobacteria bacterium]|nr:type II secretion system GspH family protein [Gammaproteobacteria bacterium]MBU1731862.1 type II secretion system GspH family protein [Gammaproteobacteria bacterium]MBU1892473.1 type II secretion system GspH family protein [Gammaproteobacteria bacterium]